MNNQEEKSLTLIRIIISLLDRPKTLGELSSLMGFSKRTILRHLQSIERIGFDVDKKEKKYFICDNTPFFKSNATQKFLKIAGKQKDRYKRKVMKEEFESIKGLL